LDTKALAGTNKIFGELDEQYNNLIKKIREKNIEIKTLKDIERVEVYISSTLKTSISLVKSSGFDKFIIDEMEKAVVKELVGRFSERYALDPLMVVNELDGNVRDLFKKAIKHNI